MFAQHKHSPVIGVRKAHFTADFEERGIAASFARNAVPLDVMIVDMDCK